MISLALLALAVRPVLSIDIFFDPMGSCSHKLLPWDVQMPGTSSAYFQYNKMCPDRSVGYCANLWGPEHSEPSITSPNFVISGGSQLTIEYEMVVINLDGDEACYVEYSLDGGRTFTTLASHGAADQVGKSQRAADQKQVIQQSHQLPLSDTAGADEISLRFRLDGSPDWYPGWTQNECYINNVALTELSRPTPPTPPQTTEKPGNSRRQRGADRADSAVSSLSSECTASFSSEAFEVLSGGGSVLRSYLTYDQLTQASFPWSGPLNYRAMAIVSGNAAEPVDGEFAFEGVFELDDVDDVNLNADAEDAERLTLPPISAELVQHGSYLLPVPADRALLGVGRVWREDGDHGMLRAALPFSLTDAKAVHNGVLMFLFDATSISSVWYQITSGTDIDYAVNMFGAVTASYTPSTVAAKCDIIDAYATEVTNDRAAARAHIRHIGSELEEGEGAERGVDTALIAITTDQALALAVALLICVNVCVAMEIMLRRARTWCKKTSYAKVQWGAEDSEAVMQSEAEQILQVSN